MQDLRPRPTKGIIVILAGDSLASMKCIREENTAVLIFARSSEEELRHKKIRRGRSLFDALTRHTLNEVQKTELPFYHFDEALQTGRSFGERFANAIQKVFDQGYDRIITIGNDSPLLTHQHIEEARASLNHKGLIIGPSSDGGFYLMGLHRHSFKRKAFEKLSWQTSIIKQEVIALMLPSHQKALLLPELFDIDSLWDVTVLAKDPVSLPMALRSIIQSIIGVRPLLEVSQATHPRGSYYNIPPNKGSPARPLF